MTTTARPAVSVAAPFSEIIVVAMASFRGILPPSCLSLLCAFLAVNSAVGQSPGTSYSSYRGRYIGPITAQKHKVSGEVFAVDSRTIHIRGFTYDGTGPDAFFWTGFTELPGPQGVIIPNERGTKEVLGAYNNQDITISLPDGLSLRDIKWIAVWCRAYEVNFGDLILPPNLDYPQPHVVGSLVGQHGVTSGPVIVVDAQTILVPDFTYDGQAPDLHFWAGRGVPGPSGLRIPDETGTDAPLQKADKKTMVLSLPGDLTIYDLDYFGVWCRLYSIDFGHVRITPGLNVPPSLRMLGISPQHSPLVLPAPAPQFLTHPTTHTLPVQYVQPQPIATPVQAVSSVTVTPIPQQQYYMIVEDAPSTKTQTFHGKASAAIYQQPNNVLSYQASAPIQNGVIFTSASNNASKLNCEKLHEDSAFEIRWSVVESGETIVFQMVGRIRPGKYMAFGLSGDDDRSTMVGGDAFIGYFDHGRGNVLDYHLGGKAVCQGNQGSCPDSRLQEGANNVRMLSAASVNGFTILTFQRKLKAMDGIDKRIRTNGSQPIIWAIGSLQDGLAGYHDFHSDDMSIDFGRVASWNCPEPEADPDFAETIQTTTTALPVKTTEAPEQIKAESLEDTQEGSSPIAHPNAWNIPPIPCNEPDDGIYYVHIGPSGRKDVFKGITGKSDQPPVKVWYVNGLLMPEIHLVRGRNYTFVVQGGDNGFYLTTDPLGDYEHAHKKAEVFSGVEFDLLGNARPTGIGKLCRWSGTQAAESFASYAAYQRSLSLDCGKGPSGILQFTPGRHTPNLLFYQSFSRPNMGWKIHVHDKCDPGPLLPPTQKVDQNVGESRQKETFLRPNALPQNFQAKPLSGHGQPLENAYIIDTSGGGSGNFPSNLPLDGRIVLKENKPMEGLLPQGTLRQPVLTVGQGSPGFSLPQGPPGIYQIAIEGGDASAGIRPSVFQPTEFLSQSHFLKRTGSHPQAFKYSPSPSYFQGERPDGYYEGNNFGNRPPPMSFPPRFENQSPNQVPTLVFATTNGPQRRNGGFIHHDMSEPLFRGPPTPPPTGRPQLQNNGARKGPFPNENLHVKYMEFPGPQFQMMPMRGNEGRASNGPWAQYGNGRNLPKRESKDREPFLRREILRESLRRIARDQYGGGVYVDLQDDKEEKSPNYVGEDRSKPSPTSSDEEDDEEEQQILGESQPIAEIQEQEFQKNKSPVPSDPVFESFTGPVFRPSPFEREGFFNVTPSAFGLLQAPGHVPNRIPEIKVSSIQALPPPPHSFSAPPSRVIKHRLRELLRQPALIPQVLRFPSKVRELVRASGRMEARRRKRPTWGERQVHKGHKVFRPRNDHIAPLLIPAAVPGADQRSPDASDASNSLRPPNLLPSDINEMSLEDEGVEGIIPRTSSHDDPLMSTEDEERLSLTLLTDVWQIINQQGISIQGSSAPQHHHHPPSRRPAKPYKKIILGPGQPLLPPFLRRRGLQLQETGRGLKGKEEGGPRARNEEEEEDEDFMEKDPFPLLSTTKISSKPGKRKSNLK